MCVCLSVCACACVCVYVRESTCLDTTPFPSTSHTPDKIDCMSNVPCYMYCKMRDVDSKMRVDACLVQATFMLLKSSRKGLHPCAGLWTKVGQGGVVSACYAVFTQHFTLQVKPMHALVDATGKYPFPSLPFPS